jgi:cell wall-associated NlpC family hydrolase
MGTAAEKAAVAWAQARADAHETSYNLRCLAFVFDSYEKTGTPLRPKVNYSINTNTYPVDIWGRFVQGSTGQGTPPYGALVFWKASNGDRTLSHVALSLGGGNLISTSDGVAGYTHYETLGQHSWAIYLGWWLPDR